MISSHIEEPRSYMLNCRDIRLNTQIEPQGNAYTNLTNLWNDISDVYIP